MFIKFILNKPYKHIIREKRNMNKLSEEQKEEIIKQYDKMVYNYVYGIYDQALNFVYMLENDEIDNVEIKFI